MDERLAFGAVSFLIAFMENVSLKILLTKTSAFFYI